MVDTDTDYPTFTYSLSDASPDLQLVLSLEPDYVFELTGEFDAIAKGVTK
jgi:hypothetical protein